MGGEFDYLEEMLWDEIKKCLDKAKITDEIDEIEGGIEESAEGTPECGAFTTNVKLTDSSTCKVLYIVYRLPRLFDRYGLGYEEGEYDVSVQMIMLQDGSIIKEDAIRYPDEYYAKERTRLISDIKKLQAELTKD